MCGIAGILSANPIPDVRRRVERMTRELARRGPDNEGIHCVGRGALGHRRLAIFDLSSAGCQPMRSADDRVTIVFNGAIYNFRELRKELERDGRTFKTQTDTEVLIEGFVVWGIDELVRRLRGMFAFVIWDAQSETAYLVRDRLGVKPLVFLQRDRVLAFASTPRSLVLSGLTDGELSMPAVIQFLEHGYVTEQHCMYEGMQKLPPACIAVWKDGALAVRKYWHAPEPSDTGSLSFDAAVEQAESLLLAAVARRLDADVPVGALLSGGIDSGLVCWAIRQLGGDVSAFTVAAPGDAADESADARATATELGIQHTVLPLTDAAPADLSDLITAYAEPFAVESALGMLGLSRAVDAAGIKVLLTGDGGDDVFLGYSRHKQLLMVERWAARVPAAATPLWRAVRRAVPQRGPFRRAVHLTDYVVGGLPAYLDAHDGLPFYQRHGMLGDRLKGLTAAERGGRWGVASARGILGEYLRHDLEHQFLAEYLVKVDGGTMHHAIEARAPFLDQDLWEFAASLPTTLRLHNGELKAVLRAIARRRIGKRVASLRKQGFAVPVQRWLAGRWQTALDDMLCNSELERAGWIHASEARKLLQRAARGGQVPKQLWYIMVLEQWVRADRERAEHAVC